VTELWTQG